METVMLFAQAAPPAQLTVIVVGVDRELTLAGRKVPGPELVTVPAVFMTKFVEPDAPEAMLPQLGVVAFIVRVMAAAACALDARKAEAKNSSAARSGCIDRTRFRSFSSRTRP
jgi:hypothetical protein